MKVLCFDIENFPAEGLFWDRPHETSIIKVTRDPFMLCFAYSWMDGKIHWEENTHGKNDKELVWKLRNLLDEADWVVGQNSDSFDLKFFNTRAIIHHIPPPSFYRTKDTLKMSRKNFKFLSHRLDYSNERMGHTGKVGHEGFPLWEAFLAGDPKARKKMKEYNMRDVEATIENYKDFAPWDERLKPLLKKKYICPKCNSENGMKGGTYTVKGPKEYQKYHCNACGHNWHGAQIIAKI